MKLKGVQQILLMSKFALYGIFLQCFLASFIMARNGNAQKSSLEEIHLSLNIQENSLQEVFEKIESKTDFFFAYKKDLINQSTKLNFSVRNESLADVLRVISKNTNLRFKRINNNIYIGKKSIFDSPVAEVVPEPEEIVQLKISGTVTSAEDGELLPGVSILVKGTSLGTTTNFDGKFVLEVPENSILQFSYIGFETQEVQLGNQTQLIVALNPDMEQLEEVVVIGYGTQKKSDLTGSVSSIKAKELNATPTARLDQALIGKVAGVQVTPTSSAPGAAATIRIRGSNSIQANNEPLFVIDGFIGAGNLNDINMNDVASVEVLKDASATAIYGSRGSNGVIIITTKKGSSGKSTLTYDTYYSVQSPTRLLNMMNASEYGDWINEVKGTNVFPNPGELGEGTDWQNEVYKKNALMVNHNLSFNGGNEKSRYYISGNYFDQDGIHIESNFKRYQLRVNTDHKIGEKFKLGQNLTISRTINNQRTSGAENLLGWDPSIPVKDADGNFTYQTVSSELSADNPVSNAVQNQNQLTGTRILGNVFGELEIIEGLSYKLNLGANLYNTRREQYAPSTLFSQTANQGTATITNFESLNLLIENTLNYSKTFGKHQVGGLLGYTRQTITETSSNVQTTGFVTDAYSYHNLGAGTIRSGAGSNFQEEGLESYLFRANYEYNNRYLLTISARADGSSVFAKNNKWGVFPSIAAAWRIKEENFMQNTSFFDDLKLRASYGELGNPGVNPGASLTRLGQVGNNYILGVNQDIVAGIAANTFGNDNLKWETTKQFNIGIDASFISNRLQTSLDYFSKSTQDLLVDVPLLWLTGFETSLSNFGEVTNKGLELTLTSINIDSKDFRWETNFNISSYRNKIASLDTEEGQIFINPIGRGVSVNSAVLQEGQPMGTFYGMVSEGIWHSQSEIDASGLSGFSVFPGARRYADLDGDNVIDATADRQIIGNPNPDFFGGIGNTLSWKGFELYLYFSFIYGNEIFNETDSRLAVAFDNNTFQRFVNRWTPDNMDTDIPSAQGVERPLTTSNTSVIEDGSFLRLRNLNIAYNLPVDKISWLSKAKIYASGTNLILFDKYSGYDPEINRGTENTKRGYDLAQDPAMKTLTMGLKLDF
ncbi:TonB-dependent receptor [Flexithrix dorotheae]|uniref:TonB-dependent receptor n=1 Tax=Flexithrix dorotheae TaxID=70993 RepID=UPI00146DBB73|nr:TonB-dependent receptor [Flexithrix dorotheae]